MCGIVGQASYRTRANMQIITNMVNTIVHRGPDDNGIWIHDDQHIALGHCRLSIMDVSSAGHQPMSSGSGRFIIVFNGEIYNHLELRQRLERDKLIPMHRWVGTSDTETLLACIDAWGIDKTLQNLVGMFAFALWDKRKESLILARDRIGEKPLYYGWQDDVFLFGSELKSLKAHPAFKRKIDWSVANNFLRLNYVPSPWSIYQNIYKLIPGTILRLTRHDINQRNTPEPVPYWSLGQVALQGYEKPFTGSFIDAVDELEILVKKAVSLQSVADVPVGAFLSGGIDSSTIVAMMQTTNFSDVTTFSIGMPDETMDESQHAAAVASHLGTKHIEHIIQPHEAIDIIPSLSQVWDEPFGDSSQIPTYLVSKLAREHVTVALSGDGGDEFFLGYPHYPLYQKLWRTRFFGSLPWDSFFSTAPFFKFFSGFERLTRRGHTLVNAWRQPDSQALNCFWRDHYRQQAVPICEQTGKRLRSFPSMKDVASSAGLYDAGTYLPDDVLVKVDRAAMAHSLETRAPLLDHRIIQFAYSLPLKFKLGSGVNKSVLREVLYRHVPQKIVDRPKMGFSIPLATWLREDLRPWAEDLLNQIPADSEFFNKQMISQMWQEHVSGQREHTEQIWGMLSLLGFMEA